MSRPLLLIILISVLIKAYLTFFVTKSMRLPWDEESVWSVAENQHSGHDYSRYYERNGEYRKTAFHGSFTVILYDFLIEYGISKKTWIIFTHFISFMLFAVSVYFFYLLASLFLKNETLKLFCTASFAFYPSIIYYIGSLVVYENFATYLLIIFFYRLVPAARSGFTREDYIILPFIICISCLFRPQLIIIYGIILILFAFISSNRKTVWALLTISIVMTTAGFIPTMQKNKKLFGVYTLGTQSGFELLQGHNPHARGSWMHHWEDPGNVLYEYAHNHIPRLDSMNEHEASEARKKLAISWVMENPVKETLLAVRKTAIYFMPFNFEELPRVWYLDMFTLLVHLLFFAGLGYALFYRSWNKEQFVLYLPLIASLALTLIFYAGYRWRLYAEPFMILLAWIFIENVRMKISKN